MNNFQKIKVKIIIMKQFSILFMFLILAGLNSCTVVGSIHPLSENEQQFVYENKLTGQWVIPTDSSLTVTIDTVDGSGGYLYRIKVLSRENENSLDTSWCQAHLVRISGEQFLDCWVDLNSIKPRTDDLYSDMLIKKHFFFKTRFLQSDSLEIITPSPDELIKLIDEHKIRLQYSKVGKSDYLILNKPTELQKAIIETKKYPKLYKDKMVLVRS